MKKNTRIGKNDFLWAAYKEICRKNNFQEDPYQEMILQSLQRLYLELESPRIFPRLFKRSPLKSLYIWGDIGRGKTFLMDLFFAEIRRPLKRRVHFHDFMRELHVRLHGRGEKGQGSLPAFIKEIVQEAKLLCFDEFQVTNIADAMIIARVFEGLFQEGVVIVATSNTVPEQLYKDGLHREHFLPFISILREHADVLYLEGKRDYRLSPPSGQLRYFTPCNNETQRHLHDFWKKLSENAPLKKTHFKSEGPSLILRGLAKGVAWANFEDLCARPCGRGEYMALTEKIHTLILWGIPKMMPDDHNEATRFTTLIDILYDKGVKLVAAADAAPEDLYPHAGAFARTISRLYEMQHG